MKIKVTTEFTDKYTGELHRVGDEMEVSVQRVNEILSVGAFINIIEEAPEQEQEQEAPAEKAEGKRTRKTKTDTE